MSESISKIKRRKLNEFPTLTKEKLNALVNGITQRNKVNINYEQLLNQYLKCSF